ncbi:hypothetical protein Dsin_002115 [Dipteronia sinensis]|uniref:Late embryogenesis abundant protein n=1 Tax=Dipteronia sinensis TaxID=43782 RepID=A0AAE0B6L9_9ROSI|nr:hypothetical protein Dsin_002115 [Dipteronia sinensis]
MLKRSQISLLKSLSRHHFQSSPKPIYSFPTSLPAHQLAPNSFPITKLSFQLGQASYFQQQKTLFSTGSRTESGALSDYNKEVDMINLKFAEAREEIEMAMESKETVYFNEEAECARAAVKEVLDLFGELLRKLKESEKEALQRSMGLKIEQLKAELRQLEEE